MNETARTFENTLSWIKDHPTLDDEQTTELCAMLPWLPREVAPTLCRLLAPAKASSRSRYA